MVSTSCSVVDPATIDFLDGESFASRWTAHPVGSAAHEELIADAISATVSEYPDLRLALKATGRARLTFSLTHTDEPGLRARVTPLALMIERWKDAIAP